MFENLHDKIKTFTSKFSDKVAAENFEKCFFNTIDTTCEFLDDGSVFVITGDIPAMWLRDSAAQVLQYLHFADDADVQALIKGILKRQMQMIAIDPYANAFMKDETCKSEWAGRMKSDVLPKIVWERKFELDSICYPLFLATKYYEKTKDLSVFNADFLSAFDKILETINTERAHSKLSTYFYVCKVKVNKPNPKGEKGLIWCGFRASDDVCKYNYHIPDNMFMVSVLYKMSNVFENLNDTARKEKCDTLVSELVPLIEQYGIKRVNGFGDVYVSETDCIKRYTLNDDANIPSLLSIPYLEYPFLNQEIYENTRRYVLSNNNKYYYEGKVISGIGSPHTPKKYVWPLAVAMQGLTSKDESEIKRCYDMLIASDNATGYMHESVSASKPHLYTRAWFAWANSVFADFVLKNQKVLLK